jgi:hypothetical protein
MLRLLPEPTHRSGLRNTRSAAMAAHTVSSSTGPRCTKTSLPRSCVRANAISKASPEIVMVWMEETNSRGERQRLRAQCSASCIRRARGYSKATLLEY